MPGDTERLQTSPHRYNIAVQFEDVDMYGVVHHPNYLRFMERARVQLLGELGVAPSDMDGSKLGLVLQDFELRFHLPARFLDQLEVQTWIQRVRGASVVLSYRVMNRQALLVEAVCTLVCVARDGRAQRLPDELRETLLQHATADAPLPRQRRR